MAATEYDIQSGSDYEEAVAHAAETLSRGGLVVFPTETVYGLGANGLSTDAMDRLRRIKERPGGSPFTVHISRPELASEYTDEVTPAARRLMSKAWPGPLTLVFSVRHPEQTAMVRNSPDRAGLSLYHEGTIGLRCPDHALARDLLGRVEAPVIAASANVRAEAPPLSAAGISPEIRGAVDVVIANGYCRYARPSTVVRLDGKRLTVLREGVLDERIVREHTRLSILLVCTGNTCRSPMAEALCKDMLCKKLDIPADMLLDAGYVVRSAGLHGADGAPASEGAVRVMQAQGLNLSRHVARSLDLGMLRSADCVWVMCQHHLEGVTAMAPTARGRVRLLADDQDIQDPIGQDQEQYDACAQTLARALRKRLEEIEL